VIWLDWAQPTFAHRNLGIRWRMLKKSGKFFSADLHHILWNEEKFCRPLEIVPLKQITLSRVEISRFFTRWSFPQNSCRTCANILVLVLRFPCFCYRHLSLLIHANCVEYQRAIFYVSPDLQNVLLHISTDWLWTFNRQNCFCDENRVARWFIYRPKIAVLVYFCRPKNGKFGYIL
jgi:hypothetical protein